MQSLTATTLQLEILRLGQLQCEHFCQCTGNVQPVQSLLLSSSLQRPQSWVVHHGWRGESDPIHVGHRTLLEPCFQLNMIQLQPFGHQRLNLMSLAKPYCSAPVNKSILPRLMRRCRSFCNGRTTATGWAGFTMPSISANRNSSCYSIEAVNHVTADDQPRSRFIHGSCDQISRSSSLNVIPLIFTALLHHWI